MKNNCLLLTCCFSLFFLTPYLNAQNLDIEGSIKVVDGTQGAGKVLTSDGSGEASWQDPTGITYSIGDFAQGGIVVWVDETGQHGLACTKNDQSASMRWYAGSNTNTMARGNGPLSGEMNTTLIIANQGLGDGSDYAALLCSVHEATEGGKTYGDWYLPSRNEMAQIYDNRVVVNATAVANGGEAMVDNGFYWTSFEFDFSDPSEDAAVFWFATSGGGVDAGSKSGTQRVRAVRRF